MQNFLVIGAAKPMVMQTLLAIHAYTDARCIVMCAKGTRYLRLSRLCSTYLETGFQREDDDGFVEQANRFAQGMPDLAIVPADCAGARMVDRARPRLTARVVPAPDAAMLDRLEDKWSFYLFCREHGLNAPPTRLIGDKRNLDFASIAQDLGIPFVVKPVNEDSSRGAYVIASEQQCRRDILDSASYRYGPLIAQRYIEGRDVGLNFMAIKGEVRAIAIQRRIDSRHDGSKIEFFANPYLQEVAHAVAAACSYDGVMNIDARIEDGTGRVFLFESNPRFWRSLSASVWCGLNFVAECIAPRRQSDEPRLLISGSADTYYHPVFRPALWRHAIFDAGHRGRMARLMASDIAILFASAKTLSLRYRASGRRIVDATRLKLSKSREPLSAPGSHTAPPGA
jgi:predicted ATP-grasp superfamily ATP-dependent carboligase